MAGPITSTDFPTSTIDEQSLIDTPTNSDATIMDDTSMTMDGSALMGGPVTLIEGLETTVKQDRVFTDVPRSS